MLAKKLRHEQPLNAPEKNAVLLSTPRLHLVIPSTEHASSMVNFLCRNRRHFQDTFPAKAEHYTEKFWHQVFKNSRLLAKNKQSLYLLLTLQDQPKNIIGNICFDGIIRGALQAGYLGFKIDKNYQHQGFMHEALDSLIKFLFNEWNIHRVMANYRIGNTDSEKLLSTLDFEKEGVAKKYLYINNQWHDHTLTSLINPHWKA